MFKFKIKSKKAVESSTIKDFKFLYDIILNNVSIKDIELNCHLLNDDYKKEYNPKNSWRYAKSFEVKGKGYDGGKKLNLRIDYCDEKIFFKCDPVKWTGEIEIEARYAAIVYQDKIALIIDFGKNQLAKGTNRFFIIDFGKNLFNIKGDKK